MQAPPTAVRFNARGVHGAARGRAGYRCTRRRASSTIPLAHGSAYPDAGRVPHSRPGFLLQVGPVLGFVSRSRKRNEPVRIDRWRRPGDFGGVETRSQARWQGAQVRCHRSGGRPGVESLAKRAEQRRRCRPGRRAGGGVWTDRTRSACRALPQKRSISLCTVWRRRRVRSW